MCLKWFVIDRLMKCTLWASELLGKNLSPFWASCHSLLASLWCREECPWLLPASPLDKVSGKPDSGLHFIPAVTQAMRGGKGWSLVLSVLLTVTNISSAATTRWALSPVLFPVTSFIFPATCENGQFLKPLKSLMEPMSCQRHWNPEMDFINNITSSTGNSRSHCNSPTITKWRNKRNTTSYWGHSMYTACSWVNWARRSNSRCLHLCLEMLSVNLTALAADP